MNEPPPAESQDKGQAQHPPTAVAPPRHDSAGPAFPFEVDSFGEPETGLEPVPLPNATAPAFDPDPVRRPFDEPSPWLPWLTFGVLIGAAGAVPPGWWWLAPVAGLLATLVVSRHPHGARLLLFLAALAAGGALGGPRLDPVPAGPRLLALTGEVEAVRWIGVTQGLAVRGDTSDDPDGFVPHRILVTGGPLPACLPGDTITARGTWVRDARGERLTSVELERIATRADGPRGWAWAVLNRLGSHRELAGTLLLGRGSPPEKDAFRRTGLLHILAVSGMHLVIAVGLGAWFLRLLGVSWQARTLLLMALACGYGWLTGSAPATERSLAMLLALSAYDLLGRKAHPLGAVSLAALVLVLLEPAVARDLGFQLSVAAVVGILTLGRDLIRWRERRFPLRPWPLDRDAWCVLLWVTRTTIDGLAVGLAATLATAPILACVIGNVAWWGPVATLLAAPPSTVAIWLGLPLIGLAGIWPSGPWEGLFLGLEASLSALVQAVNFAALLPGQQAMTAPPALVLLLWPLLFLPAGETGRHLVLRLGLAVGLVAAW